MLDSAFGPIALPGSFWHRPDVTTALVTKDMGELFRLLRFKAKITQTRIATAAGITQGRVSDIVRNEHAVRTLAVYTRIADGLNMPEHARVLLGVSFGPAPREGWNGDADALVAAVERNLVFHGNLLNQDSRSASRLTRPQPATYR